MLFGVDHGHFKDTASVVLACLSCSTVKSRTCSSNNITPTGQRQKSTIGRSGGVSMSSFIKSRMIIPQNRATCRFFSFGQNIATPTPTLSMIAIRVCVFDAYITRTCSCVCRYLQASRRPVFITVKVTDSHAIGSQQNQQRKALLESMIFL